MEDERNIAKKDDVLKKLVSNCEFEGDVYSSDEELDLPYDEVNEVSDDIEDIVFREQIRGAKNFFKEITEINSDDDLSDIMDEALEGDVEPDDSINPDDVLKPCSKVIDALSYFEMAMKKNSKMRDLLLGFKQVLMKKKQEYLDLIRELESKDDFKEEAEPEPDEIVSWGYPGYFSEINGVLYSNRITLFASQFNPPYFKDKKNFFCPPNRDAVEMDKQFSVSVSNFHPSKHWSPQCIEQLEIAIKKSLVDEFKSRADFKSIYRWREYSSFVKDHSLDEVIKAKPSDFKIDWMRVAAVLPEEERRSSTECSKLWDFYLDPKFCKDDFSSEENDKIIELAKKYGEQNWDQVASELELVRSPFQVFSYYQSSLRGKVHFGIRWTPEEDEYLKNVISSCTSGNFIAWKKVMYYFEKRNYNQVYNRWNNNIVCEKKGKFSLREDRAMMKALSHGLGYKDTAQALGGKRSMHQIRERLSAIVKFGRDNGLNSGGWSLKEDMKLLELVKIHGENFSLIAKVLGTRDRTQCRHRYRRLMKRMASDPNFHPKYMYRKERYSKLKGHKSKLLKMLEVGKITKKSKKSMLNDVRQIVEVEDDEDTCDLEFTEPVYPPKQKDMLEKLLSTGSSYWLPFDNTKTFPSEQELVIDLCALLKTKLDYNLCTDELLKDEHVSPVVDLLPKSEDDIPLLFKDNQSVSVNASTSFQILGNTVPLIPPNSLTCSGFLNSLKYCSNNEKSIRKYMIEEEEREDVKEAKELFQQRLVQLFLWPAMLSKKENINKLKTYSSHSKTPDNPEPSTSSGV